MARYEDLTSADAISDAQILERLLGGEPARAPATAQPARLVASWTLDPETGRPVCHWTVTQ